MPPLVEIPEVAVHVLLLAVKLRVQTALCVRHRRYIKRRCFPVLFASPHQALQPDLQIGARLDEHLQHRSAVVEDAVHGVEDWRLPTEAIFIDACPNVDVGPGIEQNSCTSKARDETRRA